MDEKISKEIALVNYNAGISRFCYVSILKRKIRYSIFAMPEF